MGQRSNVNYWVIQEMTASLLDVASSASQRGDQKTLQWVNNVDRGLHGDRPIRNPDARFTRLRRAEEESCDKGLPAAQRARAMIEVLQELFMNLTRHSANRTLPQQAADMLDTYRYEIAKLTGHVNPAEEALQEAALDQAQRSAADMQRFVEDARRQLEAFQNPLPPFGRGFGFPDPRNN